MPDPLARIAELRERSTAYYDSRAQADMSLCLDLLEALIPLARGNHSKWSACACAGCSKADAALARFSEPQCGG